MINRIAQNMTLALFLLSGLISIVAPKGMTVLISLAGAACFVVWCFDSHSRQRLPIAPTISLVLLFTWAGVSSAWALDPISALTLTLRVTVICFLGMSLFQFLKTLEFDTRIRMENAFFLGYGLGVMALIIGYTYAQIKGDSLWGNYASDPLTTLNNGAVVMTILYWPLFAILCKRYHPVWALGGLILMTAGLSFLSSGASLLAIVTGGVASSVVYIFGRRAGIAVTACLVITMLTAPLLTTTFLKPEVLNQFSLGLPSSAQHRSAIWQFSVQKIDEKPLLGWGMDSSRSLPRETLKLSPSMEVMPLHPHNAALQIRLELGWLGTVIAAALIISIFVSMMNPAISRIQMAIRTGAGISYMAVGAVSFGVWQNWWIAVAWAVAAIVTVVSTPKIQNN